MKYFLLFDTECASCTEVAKRLSALQVDGLEVRALTDPAVGQLFAAAGRELPNKPALVRSDGPLRAVWTGFSMRMRLARIIGVGHAAEIANLVALEVRARGARRSSRDGLSRRRMLGGAAAGAGALIFGAAAPAAAASRQGSTVTTLGAATRQRLLASSVLRQASAVWGEVDDEAITAVTGQGEKVALVSHRGSRAVTVLSTTDSEPVAITLLPNAETQSLGYYLPSGAPVVEQTVRDGKLDTHRLTTSPHGTAEPRGVPEFARCFSICVQAEGDIDAQCIVSCIGCVGGSGLSCVSCGICAGPSAVRCARSCGDEL